MSLRRELEQRLASLRAEARRGATPATFRQYEELVRQARAEGIGDLAGAALRDLATLTQELDPAIAKLLAQAAATNSSTSPTAAAAPPSTASTPSTRAELDASVIVLGL